MNTALDSNTAAFQQREARLAELEELVTEIPTMCRGYKKQIRKLKAKVKRLRGEVRDGQQEIDLLNNVAGQQVYMGNSAGYWRDKALAYKDAVGKVCDAVGPLNGKSCIDAAADWKQRAETAEAALWEKP